MMSDNAQKTPIARSLNAFSDKKINDGLQLTGKSLPCTVVSVSGSIVEVKFELTNIPYTLPTVTVPIIGSEYLRAPIQVGCRGVVRAADARLGGVNGLGAGTADLSQPGNLAALVFEPIGNTDFFPVDPNASVLYGPNGVVLMDIGQNSTIILTPAGIAMVGASFITLTCGTSSIHMTPTTLTLTEGAHATGPGLMNSVWSTLVSFLNNHTHPVTGGSGGTATATNTPYTGGSIAP